MVTHLVFFNMLPEADGRPGEENARILVDKLKALKADIPELIELEAGHDFSQTPASFQVGLLTKFRNREDLEIYRIHPSHQQVVEFVKATTSARAVVDFET